MPSLNFRVSLIGVLLFSCGLTLGCRPRERQPDETAGKQASPIDSTAKGALPKPAAPSGHASSSAEAPAASSAADQSREPSASVQKMTASGATSPPPTAPSKRADDASGAEVAQGDAAIAHASTEPAAQADTEVATREMNAKATEASWSTSRLVVLAPGGPRVLDLRINVDGRDLATGLAEATETLVEQLEFDFSAPISWEALLDKPLVQSGWLGNLVPSAEQRGELIAMYDKDNVGKVDAGEFQAFVTRGLSRRGPLRITEGRSEPPLSQSTSPWGPIDANDDGELSAAELSQVEASLKRFDFDGDGIISDSELRSTSETLGTANSMSRSQSLLELDAVLTIDPDQPSNLQRSILEHYTFADTISRSEFYHWEDRRWSELDSQASGEVGQRELAPLRELPADVEIAVSLPDTLLQAPEATTDQPSGSVQGKLRNADTREGQAAWVSGRSGGRLALPGCFVLVELRDEHSWQARRFACQQFSRALSDPQLATALAGPLGLKEGAWDLLREQGTSDAAAAWRWLVPPRHFHLTASWTTLEALWFELVDADGDRRLTTQEVAQFASAARKWDRDLNETLGQDEMPMVVSLIIAREDSRLDDFLTGGTNTEKGGASNSLSPSWFSAMDYNLDGEVTHAEFLGEEHAFEALDSNRDGIIEVREVYAPR